MGFPTNSKASQRVVLVLLCAWVFLVFSRYFSLGHVFDPPFWGALDPRPALAGTFFSNWFLFLRVLLCLWLIFITLGHWGGRLRTWMGLSVPEGLTRIPLDIALGIFLLNDLWLGLGSNGLWYEPLLGLSLMGLSLPALWRAVPRIVLGFRKIPKMVWPGFASAFLAGSAGLSLLLSMAHAILPETYFDSLVYHLSTLRSWLWNHGIADIPGNLYSHYPFGAELYFLNGFLLQGWETSKGLNVLALALCACAAAGWVRERGGSLAAWTAGSMILLSPLACACVWTTQNDVVLALFLILFYYALSRWGREGSSVSWAVAAGSMGGAALAVKYTAFLGVAAGLLALALVRIGNRKTKGLKGVSPMLLLLALSGMPWFLKNLVFTGDGFYPYFSGWFGWLTLAPDKMAALMGDHEAVWGSGFRFFPWMIQVLGKDLDKTIAPLLFSFLPFLFFLRVRREPETKFLSLICAMTMGGGFLLSHQLRLMIPAFFACFLLMALRLGELKEKFLPKIWTAVVVIFGSLTLLSLSRLSVNYHQADRIWLGKEAAWEYLKESPQTSSYMGLARAVGTWVPPGRRVLIVGDARGLYYPRPFIANSVFDTQVLEEAAREQKDGAGIALALRKLGLDALAVSGEEGARLAGQFKYYDLEAKDWDKLGDFIQHWTDLVYWEGPRGIYRIRSTPMVREGPIPNLLNLLKSPEITENRD